MRDPARAVKRRGAHLRSLNALHFTSGPPDRHKFMPAIVRPGLYNAPSAPISGHSKGVCPIA